MAFLTRKVFKQSAQRQHLLDTTIKELVEKQQWKSWLLSPGKG
ncbi:hypothetical protein [Vibrio vulnificus YJ016]|uniref:Uncharacterized protein n=1 Tax=Vibrio vulnificus (strain YJ016) TaxID=196600 RepID=Q7MNY6_VIBVY|nr:hypothetical protein VVMO6_02612 [Vibrio vulnificus MO6-24/O]BAC93343.1 hypothetical protein [Vibrio vulnificus YJ016]